MNKQFEEAQPQGHCKRARKDRLASIPLDSSPVTSKTKSLQVNEKMGQVSKDLTPSSRSLLLEILEYIDDGSYTDAHQTLEAFRKAILNQEAAEREASKGKHDATQQVKHLSKSLMRLGIEDVKEDDSVYYVSDVDMEDGPSPATNAVSRHSPMSLSDIIHARHTILPEVDHPHITFKHFDVKVPWNGGAVPQRCPRTQCSIFQHYFQEAAPDPQKKSKYVPQKKSFVMKSGGSQLHDHTFPWTRGYEGLLKRLENDYGVATENAEVTIYRFNTDLQEAKMRSLTLNRNVSAPRRQKLRQVFTYVTFIYKKPSRGASKAELGLTQYAVDYF